MRVPYIFCEALEEVKTFTYLGRIIDKKESDADVKARTSIPTTDEYLQLRTTVSYQSQDFQNELQDNSIERT